VTAGGIALVPAALAALVCARAASSQPARKPVALPERLADTGLYADARAGTIAAGVLPFSPQYPLWTDGATKRRWIRLPPGTAIDARDARAWRFPVGTRLWKEFSFGRRVETRYMERTRAGWLYATYLWADDGSDARLAPERGVPGVVVTAAGGRHDIPSVPDCKACHQGSPSEVLGFTLLQLSPDRDPLAPHASSAPDDVDVASLAARGLLRGVARQDLATPPRIAARTPRERAALGYLQGNCASCHNATGPLSSLGMSLEAPLRTPAPGARDTAVGVPSRYLPAGMAAGALRIAPGDPAASVLVRRMSSRHAAVQMPPLGTRAVDDEAVTLVTDWIRELPAPAIAHRR
jgi:hypothetical protein